MSVLLTLRRLNASAVASTRAHRRAANQLSTVPMASHIHNHTVHTHSRRVSSFLILHARSFPLHSSSFVFVFIVHDRQSCQLRSQSLKRQMHPCFLPPSTCSDWPLHKALEPDNCTPRKKHNFPCHCMFKMWSFYSSKDLIQPQTARTQ